MKDKLKIIDDSGDKKYFTMIPNYILNHSTLWDREVYIQMKRITGENGTCWTSQKTLAKQCGISINRLKKSLKYLVEHKWIKQIGTKEVITNGGFQEVNEYKVADLWKLNVDYYEAKGVSPCDIPSTKGVSPKSQRGITGEAKGVSPCDDKEEPREEEPFKNTSNEVAGIQKVINSFKGVNPTYGRLFGNTTQRSAAGRLLKQFGEEELIAMVGQLATINAMPYMTPTTTPYELERNMGRIKAKLEQSQNKIKTKIAFHQ